MALSAQKGSSWWSLLRICQFGGSREAEQPGSLGATEGVYLGTQRTSSKRSSEKMLRGFWRDVWVRSVAQTGQEWIQGTNEDEVSGDSVWGRGSEVGAGHLLARPGPLPHPRS